MIKINNDKTIISLNGFSYVFDLLQGRVFARLTKDINSLKPITEVKEDMHISYPLSISSFGHIDFRERMLHINDENQYYTYRFIFKGWDIINNFVDKEYFPHSNHKNKGLKITFIDESESVCLEQYYFDYEKDNTIVSFIKITNLKEKAISIKRAMSLQLDFEDLGYHITTFTGKWAHERHITKNDVNYGVFKNSSTCGCSSSFNNPAIMVNNDQLYCLFNLIYSGNHMSLVETDHNDTTRVLIGMNDFMEDIKLEKGESFVTPEATLTIGENENEIRNYSHHFIKDNILRKGTDFPIIFNSWEAAYFALDKTKWQKLANLATSVGAEVYVFDDGWYGENRIDETSCLGDWYLNSNKIGTKEEIKSYLKAKNLKMGLWIEPEMCNMNSQLFKKYPEFAMKFPNLEPVLMRYQLILDLANKEVIDYLIETLTNLFKDMEPDYVKWDYNRLFTDVFSKHVLGGNYVYKFYEGLYRLMSTLCQRFPDIIFEGCASGGSRFDLGILNYFNVIWTSDGTDAKERVFIQDGTSMVYPLCTESNHISISPNHQTNKRSSLEDRINVALFGQMGLEIDLTKASKNDLNTIRKNISYYQRNKDLILNGDNYVYRDENNNVISWGSINKEKTEAIYLVVSLNKEFKQVKFNGLNKATIYHLSFRSQTNIDKETFPDLSGEYLMEKGITISTLFQESDKEENEIGIASRTIRFTAVNK